MEPKNSIKTPDRVLVRHLRVFIECQIWRISDARCSIFRRNYYKRNEKTADFSWSWERKEAGCGTGHFILYYVTGR